MTLFYIECVILDATFTTPVEVAPVVEWYLSKSIIYHQWHDMYISFCVLL